ncbi:MAG: DUF6754 domain-containing protein [Anaerolineae bacterium]
MQYVAQLMDSLGATDADVAALAVLVVFLLPFTFLTARAKMGMPFALRPIRAFDKVSRLVGRASESGHPLHASIGVGGIGGESTPEALMGVTVFDWVSRHAAAAGQSVLGTMGDATILGSAQGILQQARQEAGAPDGFQAQEIQFYGPNALAYAAGAVEAASQQERAANVLFGRFGPEALWLAEGSGGDRLPQAGGTTDALAAALMTVSFEDVAIGEELYAAGAYLHRPSHLGSLATQDILRIVTILAVIAGVVITSLGLGR